MKTAMIVAWPRNGAPSVVSGPEVPLLKQRAKFKELARERVDSKVERVELWESSGGRVKTHRYRTKTQQAKVDKVAAQAAEEARVSAEERKGREGGKAEERSAGEVPEDDGKDEGAGEEEREE